METSLKEYTPQESRLPVKATRKKESKMEPVFFILTR